MDGSPGKLDDACGERFVGSAVHRDDLGPCLSWQMTGVVPEEELAEHPNIRLESAAIGP
jgi:hypothetical protein